MAVRVFQFSVVFAIGFCFGPASGSAVATGVTEIPLSLYLKDAKDVTVGRGQSATLKCEAVSSAPGSNVSWSWLYEGNPIPANDSRRQVLGDGSLFIPKVAGKRMEGQYQCLAKNVVGAVLSNPAKLKIATIGREFIEQPKNISVAEQQPVVLPCRIQSTPNALVHWERDNKPLPHSTRYVPLPLGALLITSTHSSDAGFYRCIATNKILNKKTKRSKPGQLTVLPPPKSIEPPKLLPLGLEPNKTILVGSNLTLYCAVTGWPTPTIQWFYNMSLVVGNSSILELRNVSGYATGNYSCSAYNSGGRIIMHYQVQVEQPPHFNVTPMSISYPSARTVRLECQVQGIPQPEIVWLKNGTLLETGVGRIKLQHSGLVLSHSFTTDSGIYQCVAENSAGRAWVSAQLIPYFSENRPSPPQNVQCRSFDDTSICLVWDPPTNVTIQAYSIYAFSAVPTVGVGTKEFVTNYTYQLASGIDSSTNYTLYVRSYSKEASDQSNIVLCETGIKGKRNLQIEYVSETSVKLSWSEVSNDIPCGSTSSLYKVQWKRLDQSSVNVEHTTGLKKIVSGLRPSATYEFRVQSTTNKNDEGPWISFAFSKEKSSSEVAVTTSDYSGIPHELNDTLAVPLTPQQVEADPLSPYSINLTWMNAEEDEEVFFTICYVEVKEEKSCEEGQLVKSEMNYLEVKNLKPNTMYEFKVRSQSFKGTSSSFSHSVQVQTFVDIPSPVQDLKYRVINITTVCVRWRAPLHKNGKLTKYVVSYTPDQNWPLEQWHSIDVNISQTVVKNCWPIEEDAISVVLTKLKPNAQYTVLVRAATEAGFGNPTIPLTFATKETIPYRDVIEDENPGSDNQDELQYKQKLGVALGVTVSILCILFCVSCIIFRRRCMKREALARARLAASNNYYPSGAGAPYPGMSVQLRHQESCTAEAHEMQHLVGEEGPTHIPPVTPTHLDTKGGVGFPNGQLNGTLKHAHMNGHVANGHVHITENPRYDYHDCNGHINPRKPPKQESLLPSLRNCARRKERNSLGEDPKNYKHTPTVDESQGIAPYDIPQTNARLSEIPTSNSASSKAIKRENSCSNVRSKENPREHRENGKLNPKRHDVSEIRKIPDYNSNCNSGLDEMYKLRSGSPAANEVLDSSRDDDLNVTQLTCLDDSFSMLPASHRRVSPALGPNG